MLILFIVGLVIYVIGEWNESKDVAAVGILFSLVVGFLSIIKVA